MYNSSSDPPHHMISHRWARMASPSSYSAILFLFLLLLFSDFNFSACQSATTPSSQRPPLLVKGHNWTSPAKYGEWGASEGRAWDDGVYEYIGSFRVRYQWEFIESVEFKYYKTGQWDWSDRHGRGSLPWHSVRISEVGLVSEDLEGEGTFLTRIEGYYGKPEHGSVRINGLSFHDSNGNVYIYGAQKGTHFSSPSTGNHKIVGFFGRSSGSDLTAIGVYLVTNTTQKAV